MLNPIVVYEALAIATAVQTSNGQIAGRRVVSHIDSSAAKGSIISGYSPNETLNAVVGKVHKAFATCSAWPFFVYVQTKFNLADTLTRFELESIVSKFGVRKVVAHVPL